MNASQSFIRSCMAGPEQWRRSVWRSSPIAGDTSYVYEYEYYYEYRSRAICNASELLTGREDKVRDVCVCSWTTFYYRPMHRPLKGWSDLVWRDRVKSARALFRRLAGGHGPVVETVVVHTGHRERRLRIRGQLRDGQVISCFSHVIQRS
jgi:hypothetical protein